MSARVKPLSRQWKRTPVSCLRLSVRVLNVLCRKLDIKTAGELARKTEFSLFKVRHLGLRALIEIQVALREHGMQLHGPVTTDPKEAKRTADRARNLRDREFHAEAERRHEMRFPFPAHRF